MLADTCRHGDKFYDHGVGGLFKESFQKFHLPYWFFVEKSIQSFWSSRYQVLLFYKQSMGKKKWKNGGYCQKITIVFYFYGRVAPKQGICFVKLGLVNDSILSW